MRRKLPENGSLRCQFPPHIWDIWTPYPPPCQFSPDNWGADTFFDPAPEVQPDQGSGFILTGSGSYLLDPLFLTTEKKEDRSGFLSLNNSPDHHDPDPDISGCSTVSTIKEFGSMMWNRLQIRKTDNFLFFPPLIFDKLSGLKNWHTEERAF